MATSLHFREEEDSEEEEEEENQENGESDGKKADEVVSQDYPMARYVKTSAHVLFVIRRMHRQGLRLKLPN